MKKISKLDTVGDVDTAKVEEYRRKFIDKVGMDLNTSSGLTILYDALKDDASGATKRAIIAELDRVLSLGLIAAAEKMNEKEDAPAVSAEDQWIVDLINERAAAKKNKDYARADAIRAELAEKGITLIDTKDGTTFKKG